MKQLLLLSLTLLLFAAAFAQGKRLVVLGSSTAAGTGALPADSAWVVMLHKFYKDQGTVDSTFNLAISGTNPYIAMPTGYVPPPNRPSPNTSANITRAIDTQANVVIVSFVSNQFNTASTALNNEEIKNTLFTIKNAANAAGIVCFITTTQPRTEFNNSGRQRLANLKDSIIDWFGDYAINIFDPLVNPLDNTIRPEYASPDDQIHLNNAGHKVVLQQVLAKNIFSVSLPAKLLEFNARKIDKGVSIRWKSSDEEESTTYSLQRSNNGVQFTTLATIKAKHIQPIAEYEYTDVPAGSGTFYYRLQVTENARKFFSPITIVRTSNANSIKIYPVPASNILNVVIESNSNNNAVLQIVDRSGQIFRQQNLAIKPGNNTVSLPITDLKPGQYFLQLQLADQPLTVVKFVKQ